MNAFIACGLNDMSIPYRRGTDLPAVLNIEERSQFIKRQASVRSDTLDLERGEHLRIDHGDVLFETKQTLLGYGSQGTTIVERVVSKATGKVYARKLINRKKKLGQGKQAQEIYENEIKALSKVAHDEHLIQVRGTYTDRRYLAMLLEPVADCNLKSFMDNWPLHSKENQTRFGTYFGCLAHTIRFLHSDVSIIHKDIKPENVLLKDGHLILTDFGTAYDWSGTSQSMTMSNAGDSRTPRYQSPEVAMSGHFHRSSDIWSLGVVFLEMMTVLCGSTLTEMDDFLHKNGRGVIPIHMNLVGAMKWLQTCENVCMTNEPTIDSEPIRWIEHMLDSVESNRPTAEKVEKDIAEHNAGEYCGRCCRCCELNPYGDEDSDSNMSSSITEHEARGIDLEDTHRGSGVMTYLKTDLSATTTMENEGLTPWSSKIDPMAQQSQATMPGPQASYQPLVVASTAQGASSDDQGTATASTLRALSLTSKKGSPKMKSKPFLERDKFKQWLASVPEKFASSSMLHRSIPAKHYPISPLHGPTVRTQMVKHYLSTLPEDAADFEDSPEEIRALEQLALPLELPGRSNTMPIIVDIVLKPTRSEENLQSLSHSPHEETEDEPLAEITKPKLFHYASDGDLKLAIEVSKTSLQEATKDLKDFANTSPIFHEKQVLEVCSTLPPTIHEQEKYRSEEFESTAPVNADPAISNLNAKQVQDLVDPIVPNDRANQDSTQIFGDQREHESARSTQTLVSAKDPLADVPARLGTFINEARPLVSKEKRQRQWESATAIMDRILDDNASVAPTSLISANTRNKISSPRFITLWNDKAYGWLPSMVIDGKVKAVEQLLRAGCNPGTLEKERWAPMFNAIKGASDRHTKCLKALIAYGANVRTIQKSNGRTFLHYAIRQKPWPGYSSVIYTLLAAKADPNIRDKANDLPLLMLPDGSGPLPQEKRDALFLLLAPNFNLNLIVKNPSTLDNPLHFAIHRKDAHTVDAILEKIKQIGSSVMNLIHERNHSGFTPIFLGFSIFEFDKDSDEELQIIKLLLREGANPNDKDDIEGKTPLHLVLCASENSIALELLCRHSADPQIPDKSGQTPLDLVCKSRADHPEKKWYEFAEHRMMNRLSDTDFRPRDLKDFLAEENNDQIR